MYRTAESPPADQNIGLSQSADWRERLGGALIVCVLLLGALALIRHGLQESQLTCDSSGQCHVVGVTNATFLRGSIRDVRVVTAGSKTTNYYLVVELAAAPRLQITPAVSFDNANSVRTQLLAFSHEEASRVVFHFAPSYGLVVIGALVAMLALALVLLLVRGRASFGASHTVFRVSASNLQLTVYTGGKTQQFFIEEVVGIQITCNTSPQPGTEYGLTLLMLSGEKNEVAPLRPGPKPVLQAATALRRALLLPAVDDVELLTHRLGGRLSWIQLLRNSAGTFGALLVVVTAVVGGSLILLNKLALQGPTTSPPLALTCALVGAALVTIVLAAVVTTAGRSARLPPW